MKKILSFMIFTILLLGLLVIQASAAEVQYSAMRLEKAEGEVAVSDAAGMPVACSGDMALGSGWTIETGDDSFVWISLDDAKAIVLGMNTSVTVRKSGKKFLVLVNAGEIVFNVTTPLTEDEALEIRNSKMVTSVRGSSGGVNAETGEIFYGTGHGIVWFRETDQTSSLYGLSQRTELWGGRIVSVKWPVKDMELSDFSALFLGEVAENPDLQNSLKMEGRFDPQELIAALPAAVERETAEREKAKEDIASIPVVTGEEEVNPAFGYDTPISDESGEIPRPTYTVIWRNDDGTELETDRNVPHGTTPTYDGKPPTKPDDEQYTYIFKKWDPDIVEADRNAIYTATYTPTLREYTITWKQDDGDVIDTTMVTYGTTPTHTDAEKTADAEYTYTFAGWSPEVSAVSGEATYTATYTATLRKYTITWKQDDGSLIDTTTVAYGTTPTHSDPAKAADAQYTYTFSGWSPEVSAVTGDATYTATYTTATKTYTVTWQDADGTILETDEDVPYDETPTYDGKTPTKAADPQYTYTFAGWSPEVATVSADVTYTATYSGTLNTYTVTWQDADGTALKTDANVAYGTVPAYDGETPTKAADAQYTYAFAGWDTTPVAVTGDATYTATYTTTTNTYTVIWKDADGTVLETDANVPYGATPTYDGEKQPAKAADAQYTYVFAGWSPAVSAVSGDATYTATYTGTVNTYTVIWKDADGTVLETDANVAYGTTPTYDGEKQPAKAADAQYTYAFSGWSPAVSAVSGDTTYTATYTGTVNTYTVTWKDADGTVLETDANVPYGTTPTYDGKDQPSKAADAQYTYAFAGWSPAVAAVTGDATYTATYSGTVNTYTVTWKDADGTVLETDANVAYGANPTYDGDKQPAKAADAQYTYTFSGWSPAVAAVTGDATYTATYSTTVNTYTVIWKDEDGTVLETDENVPYGTEPTYNDVTPAKAEDAQYTYAFSGWSPAVSAVTGNATYTAVYTSTVKTYTVTWKQDDGTVIDTATVAYGETPTHSDPVKAATAQYSYIFAGWTTEINTVTGDVSYTATYTATVNTYTVTWKNDGGAVLETDENVPYGTVPTYDGKAPTKEADAQYTYTYAGWDTTPAAITGDTIYTATYTETLNKYKITFVDDDGTTVLGQVLEYDYGTPANQITRPTVLTREAQGGGYNLFAYWSPAVAEVRGDATYKAVYYGAVSKIIIRAGTANKPYDGTELTCSTYEVDGLPSGLNCTAVTSGSQLEAGISANVIFSWKITDGNGNDVSQRFQSYVELIEGELTVY